jgi:predicted unusual protein kinase regulating ubiquinone biosynthesis (AarF/ABC1/UbiB family)
VLIVVLMLMIWSICVVKQVFLMQLLDMGFFHSDPHPGNLLVDQDGRLTLIDFGTEL